ncbi:MAG: MATE family efflux transporter, partial [Ruminococcus sp.]
MKKMKLFNLAWPIFIETALFMLLGFIDVFVLSKYNDLAASSVNTANQAVSIVTIVFTVISGASAVIISQCLGAKNKKGASRVAALSLTFNFAFGIIISGVLLIFNAPILKFIGAEGKILEYSSQYLAIVGGTLFLQAMLSAISVIIRNHGMTQISMYVTVGMNIVNTVLDVVFVLGLFGMPRLGVLGVAIATSFSRFAGTIVLLIVLFKKIEKPSIFKLLKPFPWGDVKNIIKIGVPSALETFLYNLSQLVITSIVLKCMTETDLITKTYVQNITMFF